MLSGTGAALATSHAKISSVTVLQTSLPTAVTGAKVTFAASVENAANDAPITSGKVTFEVESPKKMVLGVASVNKLGQFSLSTDQLTKIATDRVEAEYAPSSSRVSASTSAPVTVKVIPQPLHVPTTVTVEPVIRAESGQNSPLAVTVKDAGTGNQVDAGKVQPITGTVQIYTNSPHRIILGEIELNQTKPPTSAILPALESIIGVSNQQSTAGVKQQTVIWTNKLTDVGPNQIEAKFLPTNDDFTTSTSAPKTVTITPRTRNAPTVTELQGPTNTVEKGEIVTLGVTVHNPNASLTGGTVKLTTVSPHPVVLGKVSVSASDQQVGFATKKLQEIGPHEIQAVYMPSTNRFARSTSAPITVTVTPLTATSFRVKPVVRHGHLNQPLGFEVTALDAQGQSLTNYTGTVVFTSPTDSRVVFPPAVYASLNIGEEPANAPGLATITPQAYTFTPADHGSRIFAGAVAFGKAGAETIQVIQANDIRVRGKATFSIK